MKLLTGVVGDVARRVVLRGALAAAAFAVLFAVSLLSPGVGEGTGTSVDNKVVKIRADYTEPCQPGKLNPSSNPASTFDVNANISSGNPKVVELVSPGDIGGCFATDASLGYLLIQDPGIGSDEELFGYSVVAAQTGTAGNNVFGVGSLNQTVSVTLDIQNITGQTDWPGLFLTANGLVYIDGELMHYDTRTSTTMHINQRGMNNTFPAHQTVAFVRMQGKLKLVARHQRTYVGYYPYPAQPPTYDHISSNQQARSPKIQLTCRARLDQTPQAGNDPVLSRSRCYAVIEPGTAWPYSPMSVSPPYPSGLYTGPLLPPTPIFYHDLSSGTINDAAKGSQSLTLTTDYVGFQCLPYIEGRLWVKISESVTVPVVGTSYGQFRIAAYLNSSNCSTTPIFSIGSQDSIDGQATGTNAKFEEVLQSNPSDWDMDGDGCSDYEELGDDQKFGGLRDPFNRWDYFDVNGDKYVDLPNDILGVAFKYQKAPPDPAYDANYDRGGVITQDVNNNGVYDAPPDLRGSPWNLRPPDNYIDLPNDILGVAFQYQHNCNAADHEPP